MGDDDDATCVEHVFVLRELHLSLTQSAAGSTCTRCGAPAYDDLTPPATRPPL